MNHRVIQNSVNCSLAVGSYPRSPVLRPSPLGKVAPAFRRVTDEVITLAHQDLLAQTSYLTHRSAVPPPQRGGSTRVAANPPTNPNLKPRKAKNTQTMAGARRSACFDWVLTKFGTYSIMKAVAPTPTMPTASARARRLAALSTPISSTAPRS